MRISVFVCRKGCDVVLHQDYLMRMFLQLASALRESLEKVRGGSDPEAAAERLDEALENATEFDGALLLTMTPESMAAMVRLSDPDPLLMEYVARSLLLSSRCLADAGLGDRSSLREGQAHALAREFGFSLDDADLELDELESFFERTLPTT